MKIKSLAFIIASSLAICSVPIIGAGAATSGNHEVQVNNASPIDVRVDFINLNHTREFTLKPGETHKETVLSYSNPKMVFKTETESVECVFPREASSTSLIEFIAANANPGGLPLTCGVKSTPSL